MSDILSRLLEQNGWLMADGATGTTLFNMGLRAGTAPETWNLDRPEAVRQLHSDAVAAGADIFLTNSYGGNAARLRQSGAEAPLRDLNRAAAALGRDVADAAGRPVVVAGSMGPTGEIMAPMGQMTMARATEIFHEQAAALKEGGVDLLWIETIASLEEFRAAAAAAALVDMPWCGMMSFDTAGRTMMGVTPSDLAAAVERLPNPPLAYGANCGLGMSDLLRSVLGFFAQGSERPVIAKGNAGIPRYQHGAIHYDGTPEQMADYAVLARDAGVRIIGGCCGTEPAHLRAMRAALETRPKGPRPTLEGIVARLGPFSPAA
ncbi:betaine--homocysteine S-methyltransferase [Gemmobacter serpentinus]|uniref:betaine--homocysteine S-methyltransferase n=1 Tax=Gemmobacter serpentinus TaxID=2652247 RepID=UPI00124E5A68|nr:betaine--homocysteine S-methyltransferase [Gemmobacter serpentinus]